MTLTIGAYSAELLSQDTWQVTTTRLNVVVKYKTYGSCETVLARLTRAHEQETGRKRKTAQYNANAIKACAKSPYMANGHEREEDFEP